MKSQADRRKTYEEWHVPFMDKNHLAAAGFYFTNWGDVVRCAFCGVDVCYWIGGDNVFKDHQRLSPSCGFIKGLFVGNIPVGSGTSSSQQTSRSYDVCEPYTEITPNSGLKRSKYKYFYFGHYVYVLITVQKF
jgi:hypothetical protein